MQQEPRIKYCIGIETKNGREYYEEKEGVRYFDTKDQALFLAVLLSDTDERYKKAFVVESVGTCFRCCSPLFPSDIEEYKTQCFTCDEDFYGFEQEDRK